MGDQALKGPDTWCSAFRKLCSTSFSVTQIGFTAFNSYVDPTHPRWLLHGHQHLNVESTIGATRVIGTDGHRFVIIPE